MRMIVLAAAAMVLASCTTAQMPTTNAGAGQQQASDVSTQREAPTPPALRAPRQRSGVGWPDLGYRPHGN